MDAKTARALSDLTTDFYQHVSLSFSATRQAPWQGWERVVDAADLHSGARVLDVACGNLRFERYLAERGIDARCVAVDNCDDLVRQGSEGAPHTTYRHVDIARTLYEPGGLDAALDGVVEAPVDLAVCFGFMHHVPLPEQRESVMRALAKRLSPGGVVAVSLWQFAQSKRLLAKAVPVEGGDVGDYLLGWQQQEGVWRYCHSFSEAEVDALAACCAPYALEIARFSADGKTGDLNRYLILRRN